MNFKKVFICFLLIAFQFNSLNSEASLFSISERQEITLGAQAAAQVERQQRLLRDQVVQDYISRLGQKLVNTSNRRELNYRFRVIDDPQVNAFALPGGFIYINRGLIENSATENELVGVIAHEIAHVAARHSAEQIEKSRKANLALGAADILLGPVRGGRTLSTGVQLLTQGAFLKFSRDAEREADRLGAENMRAAGWNPKGMVSFFERLSQQGGSGLAFFSTHPSPQERRNNISDLIAAWGNEGIVDSREFQSIKKRLAELPRARAARRR